MIHRGPASGGRARPASFSRRRARRNHENFQPAPEAIAKAAIATTAEQAWYTLNFDIGADSCLFGGNPSERGLREQSATDRGGVSLLTSVWTGIDERVQFSLDGVA